MPAVVDDHGSLPAPALRALAVRESRWLAAAGSRRVALLAANGRAWAISDLALVAGGMLCVPLPHQFSPAQLRHALDDAGADAILTDDPHRVLELGLGFREWRSSPHTGLALLRRDLDAQAPPLPAGTAKITYTSGSTAEPRGVCLTLAALETVAESVSIAAGRLGIARHLSVLPLSQLLENVAGLYASWLTGATCHLPAAVPSRIASGRLDPEQLLAEVSLVAPESLILVPELLRILVGGAESGWRVPGGARFFAVGGARVSMELLARAGAARLPVFQGYGLTECASVVCLNRPGANRRGSVGQPLPHARVRVDERGEIHVSGAVLAGYAGEMPGERLAEFATGDTGALDEDGFLHVSGRIRNVFISSWGRNVSPEWVESELSVEPGIAQVVAFGEARSEVVALVVPGQGVHAAAIAASVARANSRLPHYARIARYRVLREPFTPGNGLATTNGRARRQQIFERYRAEIENLFQGEDHVAV